MLVVGYVGAPAYAVDLTGDGDGNVIWGTSSGDVLKGLGGDDVLFGQGGNDNLNAGKAPFGNFLFLGPGQDTAKGSAKTDLVVDEDGTGGDVIKLGDFGDVVFSRDSSIDNIDCGDGHDTAVVDGIDKLKHCEIVFVLNTDVVIVGTTQSEFLNGDTESNFIAGDKGGDTIHGGDEPFGGDAFLSGGPSSDTVFGDRGNDVIFDDDGTAGDILNGDAGDDLIFAADGAAGTINCGSGSDRVIADTVDTVNADCESVMTGASAVDDLTFSPF